MECKDGGVRCVGWGVRMGSEVCGVGCKDEGVRVWGGV